MPKFFGISLLSALLVTTSACSGASGNEASGVKDATPTNSASSSTSITGAAVTMPAGFATASGTAYQFGLPSNLKFVANDGTVTDDGGLMRRWRYAITPSGPFCIIVGVEQAQFTGQFPASVLALFDAKTQPDQKTLRNAVMTPVPAGTIGGVDQESTFTGSLDDGTTFPAHLYQRKYLTTDRSLIALTVAGPESHRAECQLSMIINTFSATGRQFTGATPKPSSTTSGIPAPGATDATG